MKILGTTYKLKYVDNLDNGDWGYSDLISKQIVVVKNKQQKETLIHELVHCVLFEMGFEEKTQDEEIVNIITKIIITIMKSLKVWDKYDV